MIKKLRRKFILISMLSVAIVLFLLMASINIVNYRSVVTAADRTLQILADNGGTFPKPEKAAGNGQTAGSAAEADSTGTDAGTGSTAADSGTESARPGTGAPAGRPSDPAMRRAMEMPYDTRYFTVSITEDGSEASADTTNIAAVTSADAIAYARKLEKAGRTRGFLDDYRFTAAAARDSTRTLYIFVDCTRDLASFRTFLAASTGISLLGLALVFLLVFFLSKAAVRPVAESYGKQKRFITDASHELKTPLAIIRANTEVLEMTNGASEWTKSTEKQIDRLTSLVERMVFLSRMDEENAELVQMAEFDLSEAVLETADPYRTVASSKDRHFETDVAEGIRFTGDEGLLRQLVSLLLDNAVKYSDEGGQIRLALKGATGKRITLTVSNTVTAGSIKPGSHQEFFDRFYRADSARNSKSGSFGIGLSVALAIVSAHHGRITAESPDGNSCVFTVTL